MVRKYTRSRVGSMVALLGVASLALVACGGAKDAPSSNANQSGDAVAPSSDVLEEALEKGGELTYWTWTPSAEAQVAAFEAKYPNVKVNVANVGTNTEQYTKLQNAIQAGSGAPDVAQVEYYAIPQFSLSDSLVDLSEYGFGDLADQYTPGPWSSVTEGDKVWGLPQDSGPMALFYNKAVFDAAGITEAPKTWDEFAEAAKKINEHDSSVYITNDSGDAGFTTSMIWQAGGHPFSVEGTDVTINLQDEGAKKWADMWSPLVEDGLISPIAGWSNEWYQGLNQGKIASLITGAWMPGTLISAVEETAGDWRVAPIPTYDGTAVNAENGGGGQVVVKQSQNPELAAAFLKWLNNDPESIKIFLESGGFPATVADLESEEFLSQTPEYFGGQEINRVLAAGASDVLAGWNYLPYQVYANSIFGDTVGSAYANKTDINAGLKAWQEALVEYGNAQGFTVTGE